jgi:large subunit ribosomal protein L13
MNKTTWLKAKEVERDWFVFDVEGQTLGRACTKIAKYLMGKNNPTYDASLDMGNNVIIVNIEKVTLTGGKEQYVDITRYSGYPGGLTRSKIKDLLKNKPDDVIRHAIKGMLPNNKLRDRMLARLYLYAGAEHKHEAQKPEKINL